MNLPTVIVALVVAGLAFLAARSLRKSGSCDCGGGCSAAVAVIRPAAPGISAGLKG